MIYIFFEIINVQTEAKVAVTSVTNVTTMKYNELYMLQAVTKCYKMLQTPFFSGFVTDVSQLIVL